MLYVSSTHGWQDNSPQKLFTRQLLLKLLLPFGQLSPENCHLGKLDNSHLGQLSPWRQLPLRIISLVEYFLALNKLCKTVYMNLFSIKIDLLPFSLAIRETSAIFDGISYSDVSFFVFINSFLFPEVQHNLWVILRVSSGKIPIFLSHKIFSKYSCQKKICDRVRFL